jgi:outer membrane protein OmpU|tara:strand:- start:182 stop:1255 length:1074 start_codon:yes stop_codon:yes gene_type:complete
MNNLIKGEIMNKLTKVGISALAGSLAAVGAHASEYSVTGDTQIVYSSAEGNEASAQGSNGKGFGMDTDLYFTAGGELDNGWTVSVFTAMDMEQSNTATSGGLNSSAQMTIGMGSLGTVQFNDVSGSAANAIDDVLPKAYEETWDGTTHSSAFHSFGSGTQSGSVDYRTPAFDLGGLSVSATYTYDPNSGVGAPGAGGVGSNSQEGDAWTVKISGMGLTLGGGYEEKENANTNTGAEDANLATGYALFSQGPVTIGYQEMYQDSAHSTAGTQEGADVEGDGFGISFSQDAYSISYAEVNEKVKQNSDTTAELETEMEALQATYTMGAMTLGVSFYETSNPEGTTGKYEETEVSVSFAF